MRSPGINGEGGNRLTQVHLEKWPLKRECACVRVCNCICTSVIFFGSSAVNAWALLTCSHWVHYVIHCLLEQQNGDDDATFPWRCGAVSTLVSALLVAVLDPLIMAPPLPLQISKEPLSMHVDGHFFVWISTEIAVNLGNGTILVTINH